MFLSIKALGIEFVFQDAPETFLNLKNPLKGVIMGRPRKNPDIKNGQSLKVYLDKTSHEKLNDFTKINGLSYMSNAARFIIISFLEQNQKTTKSRDGDRQAN